MSEALARYEAEIVTSGLRPDACHRYPRLLREAIQPGVDALNGDTEVGVLTGHALNRWWDLRSSDGRLSDSRRAQERAAMLHFLLCASRAGLVPWALSVWRPPRPPRRTSLSHLAAVGGGPRSRVRGLPPDLESAVERVVCRRPSSTRRYRMALRQLLAPGGALADVSSTDTLRAVDVDRRLRRRGDGGTASPLQRAAVRKLLDSLGVVPTFWPTPSKPSTGDRVRVSVKGLSAALAWVRTTGPRSHRSAAASRVVLEAIASTGRPQAELRVTPEGRAEDVSASIPAACLRGWRVLVAAQLLADYVGTLAESACTLTLAEGTLVVTCGSTRVVLPAAPVASGERSSPSEIGVTVVLSAPLLKRAITQTVKAIARAAESSPLAGVRVVVEGSQVTLTASSRARIAVASLPASPSISHTTSVVLPAGPLVELAKAIDGRYLSPVQMSIGEGGTRVSFAIGGFVATARAVQCDSFVAVVATPRERTTVVRLPTVRLAREARTACVAAAPSGVIEVGAHAAELTLMAHAGGGHPYLARLKANVRGSAVCVALEARHLVQALRTIEMEEVELGFCGPADPVVIRGVGRWGPASDHIDLPAGPR